MKLKIVALLIITLMITGCSTMGPTKDGPPTQPFDVSKIKSPKPHHLTRSHYANPPSYVVNGKRYHVLKTAKGYDKKGIASWYGSKFHGRRTSTGEPYDMFSMTAASRTLPIPVFARVTNLRNGRSVIVKVNDRGPFANNRIIDLSYVAAKKLGYAHHGTTLVEVKTITFLKKKFHKVYLQVAAFKDRMNALALKARLHKLIQKKIRVHSTKYHQHWLYRVEIGPFAHVKESDKLQQLLKLLGLGQPLAIIS
jgi:rare lipoprotein A